MVLYIGKAVVFVVNCRACAQINLDAAAENMQNIRKATNSKSMVMAVVKADAYGHGALDMAKTFLDNGADRLAVATIDEAVHLRKEGIDAPLMILGIVDYDDIPALIKYSIIPAVCDYEFAKDISDKANAMQLTAKIHIKLDIGMSRIGFVVGNENEKIINEIIEIAKLPNIEIEGIFTHFSTSDEKEKSYTELQFERFITVCDELKDRGVCIPIKHVCNSAAIMMYPHMHLDMVRAGIILYGLYPSNDVDKSRISLKPVMTLKAKITMVKETEAGRGVSYGKEYITDEKDKIATISIGYADGYIRKNAKNGVVVLYDGTLAPVIGRICMDQCMIDVTNVHNINKGDEVVLFGDTVVTADDVAKRLDTINYEVVCMVSKRIPRVYIKNGKAVKTLNYLV